MFTGERVIAKPNNELYQKSLKRYQFCCCLLKPHHQFLDISCGTGYGSLLLARYAKKVIGVDVDPDLILTHQKQNCNPKITFKLTKPETLDSSLINKFDVIVSLETIEHCLNQKLFLTHLKHYVKQNGTIIISTPNNYRRLHPPTNRYHHREYHVLDLFGVLKKLFSYSSIHIYGQGQTSYSNNPPIPNPQPLEYLVKYLFSAIYNFDLRYTHLLEHINHLSVYQKIGHLQGYSDDLIYPIDPTSFFHPTTAIFVINQIKK